MGGEAQARNRSSAACTFLRETWAAGDGVGDGLPEPGHRTRDPTDATAGPVRDPDPRTQVPRCALQRPKSQR